MLATFATGAAMLAAGWRHARELRPRDGFLLVTLSWMLFAGFASIPLVTAYGDLGFTKAYFEMVSAMTTTGATVLVGLDNAPQSINLWRHLLEWLGGLGVIVLAVAILPMLGVGGMQLFNAEATGPMKDERPTERIAGTARALWSVYAVITLACIVALWLAGMSWFEAICHAFSAMSLGGFSTRDASIGAFNSPAIEAVLVIFMMVAGINFASHFLAWRDRGLGCYLRDAEARAFVAVVAATCMAIGIYLYGHGDYDNVWTSLRHATFNTVSLATTSGYASVDYDRWPRVASFWILGMSAYASCAGSTGGGIKMVRTLILVKESSRALGRLCHPSLVTKIKVGHKAVSNKVTFAVMSFMLIYAATAIVSFLVLMASGMDMVSGLSAMIACLNNAGPGLGEVGPSRNYGSLTAFQLWVLSATMLVGRLEILSVAVLITPSFWRR